MNEKPKCPMSRSGFECGNYDLKKHNAAYLAGALSQAKADREAVGKLQRYFFVNHGDRDFIELSKALAALDEAGPK
jgi:hypothetical protein